jgi:hypothetical protein
MRLTRAGKARADNIRVIGTERSAPMTYSGRISMTRQLVAASLAVLMLAAPAVALAADPAPASSDSSSAAPAKKASHKSHKSSHKAKKDAAAPAAQ